MKVNELRIGNLIINGYGDNDNIACILKAHIVCEKDKFCLISDAKPIPLTEKWLMKFGFASEFNGEYEHPTLPMFYLWCPKELNYFCVSPNSELACFRHECKYVHQLQNLYWCLTGEELTING